MYYLVMRGAVLLRPVLSCRHQIAGAATKQAEHQTRPNTSASFSSKDKNLLFNEIKSLSDGERRSIEKIVVKIQMKDGSQRDFLMNRNISTPLDCAKHINRAVATSSALCEVEGAQYQSMNEPFTAGCSIKLLNFNSAGVEAGKAVSNAYWRSCAMLLGAALRRGLSMDVAIHAKTNDVSSGYFSVAVAGEGLIDWTPTQNELHSLSVMTREHFVNDSQPFEVVRVPSILAGENGLNEGDLLCRVGEYVDTVDGPVIAETSQIGQFSIVKILAKNSNLVFGGVSLPFLQTTSSYNWQLIINNAKMNME